MNDDTDQYQYFALFLNKTTKEAAIIVDLPTIELKVMTAIAQQIPVTPIVCAEIDKIKTFVYAVGTSAGIPLLEFKPEMVFVMNVKDEYEKRIQEAEENGSNVSFSVPPKGLDPNDPLFERVRDLI